MLIRLTHTNAETYQMLNGVKTIADKYIAHDGSSAPSAALVVWAPIKISEKERDWLMIAVLRGGFVPSRERDGESAPFLSDLRLMSERGLIKGMPWRITKFGRDCLRELEKPQTNRTPEPITPEPAPEIQTPVVHIVRRLADVERESIAAAISQCNGNKTRAARALGVSVRTIRNKLRLYEKAT